MRTDHRVRALLGFFSLIVFSAPAGAYVGPGAGIGGTSGTSIGAIVVIVLAGLVALAVLCALVAGVIAVGDRIKARLHSREESRSIDAR